MGSTIIRGTEHTIGLGAVFPGTAKTAWYKVDPVGAYTHGIYGSNVEIEFKLMTDKETNINTIAVVLSYYAGEKFETNDVSGLSMEQWKQVVGRYNAFDSRGSEEIL